MIQNYRRYDCLAWKCKTFVGFSLKKAKNFEKFFLTITSFIPMPKFTTEVHKFFRSRKNMNIKKLEFFFALTSSWNYFAKFALIKSVYFRNCVCAKVEKKAFHLNPASHCPLMLTQNVRTDLLDNLHEALPWPKAAVPWSLWRACPASSVCRTGPASCVCPYWPATFSYWAYRRLLSQCMNLKYITSEIISKCHR